MPVADADAYYENEFVNGYSIKIAPKI